MSSLCGPTISGNRALQQFDDFGGVVHRQRGLRHISEIVRVARGECGGVGQGFDQAHSAGGQLTHGADHFRVAGVADQHDLVPAPVMNIGLAMHLGHQRTSGVEYEQIAPRRFLGHRARHAMGREDDRRTGIRHLIEFLDENGALGAQAIDHVAVVHDLVAHIDRRPVNRQRALHRFDGAHHPGAEAARRAQQHLECGLFGGVDHIVLEIAPIFREFQAPTWAAPPRPVKPGRLHGPDSVPIFRPLSDHHR